MRHAPEGSALNPPALSPECTVESLQQQHLVPTLVTSAKTTSQPSVSITATSALTMLWTAHDPNHGPGYVKT